MESFKQLLGFVMLATVIWLLWVFEGQTDQNALLMMQFALLLGALGAWIYGRWSTPIRTKKIRMVGYLLSASCLFGAIFLAKEASDFKTETGEILNADGWETYSPQRLHELRAKNIPVFIDFTAKWCLICQANHMILTQQAVENKFNEAGVVRMKADWTRHDPLITQELTGTAEMESPCMFSTILLKLKNLVFFLKF